jgi:hypothetical protein
MTQPKSASSLALLEALCKGGSIYTRHGLRYELWESDASKPGAPFGEQYYLEPPKPEPPPDPNTNRIRVGWASAVRRLIRNPDKLGYDEAQRVYQWDEPSNAMYRQNHIGAVFLLFRGHPEFLYFDKVEAR